MPFSGRLRNGSTGEVDPPRVDAEVDRPRQFKIPDGLLERYLTQIQLKADTGGARGGDAGSTSGGGDRLPAETRAHMESAFGTDFSDVRVHQGGRTGALGALAYTQGADIHFAPGQYDPSSQSGRELLGHELTHVVQQRAGRVSLPQGKDGAVNRDASLEAEADTLGARAARGEAVQVAGSSVGLQRKAGVGPIQRKGDPVKIAARAREVTGFCRPPREDDKFLTWRVEEVPFYDAEDWSAFVRALDEPQRELFRSYVKEQFTASLRESLRHVLPVELQPLPELPKSAPPPEKEKEPAKPSSPDLAKKEEPSAAPATKSAEKPHELSEKEQAKEDNEQRKRDVITVFASNAGTRGRRLAEAFRITQPVVVDPMGLGFGGVLEMPPKVEGNAFNRVAYWLTTPSAFAKDAGFRKSFWESLDPGGVLYRPDSTATQLKDLIKTLYPARQAAYLNAIIDEGKPPFAWEVLLAAGQVFGGAAAEHEVVRLVEKRGGEEVHDWNAFFTEDHAGITVATALEKGLSAKRYQRLVAFKAAMEGLQSFEAKEKELEAAKEQHEHGRPDAHQHGSKDASKDAHKDPHADAHKDPHADAHKDPHADAHKGPHADAHKGGSAPKEKADPQPPKPEGMKALLEEYERMGKAAGVESAAIYRYVEEARGIAKLPEELEAINNERRELWATLVAEYARGYRHLYDALPARSADEQSKRSPAREYLEAEMSRNFEHARAMLARLVELHRKLDIGALTAETDRRKQTMVTAQLSHLCLLVKSHISSGRNRLSTRGIEEVREWIEEDEHRDARRAAAQSGSEFMKMLAGSGLKPYEQELLRALITGDGKKSEVAVATDAMFARETAKLKSQKTNRSEHEKLIEHLTSMSPQDRQDYLKSLDPDPKTAAAKFDLMLREAMPPSDLNREKTNHEQDRQRSELFAEFTAPGGGGPHFAELHRLVETSKKADDAFRSRALEVVAKLRGDEYMQARQDTVMIATGRLDMHVSRRVPLLQALKERCGESSAEWKKIEALFGATDEQRGVADKEKAATAREEAELDPRHWSILLDLELEKSRLPGLQAKKGGQLEAAERQSRTEVYNLAYGARMAAERNEAVMAQDDKGQRRGPSASDFIMAVYQGVHSDVLLTKYAELAALMKVGGKVTATQVIAEATRHKGARGESYFVDEQELIRHVESAQGRTLLEEWSNIHVLMQQLEAARGDKQQEAAVKRGFVLDIHPDRRAELAKGLSPAKLLALVNRLRARLAEAAAQDDEFRVALDESGFQNDEFAREKINLQALFESAAVKGSAWQMRGASSKGVAHQQAARALSHEAQSTQEDIDSGKKDAYREHKEALGGAKEAVKETGAAFDQLRATVRKVVTSVVALLVMSAVVAATHGAAVPMILTVLFKVGGYLLMDVTKMAVNKLLDGENFDLRKNLVTMLGDAVGGIMLFGTMGIEQAINISGGLQDEYVKNAIKVAFNQVIKASSGDAVKMGLERNVGDMTKDQMVFDIIRTSMAAMIAEMGNAAEMNREEIEKAAAESGGADKAPSTPGPGDSVPGATDATHTSDSSSGDKSSGGSSDKGSLGDQVWAKLAAPNVKWGENMGGQWERPADIIIDELKERLFEQEARAHAKRGAGGAAKNVPRKGWTRYVLRVGWKGKPDETTTIAAMRNDSTWKYLTEKCHAIYLGGVAERQGGFLLNADEGAFFLAPEMKAAVQAGLAAGLPKNDERSGQELEFRLEEQDRGAVAPKREASAPDKGKKDGAPPPTGEPSKEPPSKASADSSKKPDDSLKKSEASSKADESPKKPPAPSKKPDEDEEVDADALLAAPPLVSKDKQDFTINITDELVDAYIADIRVPKTYLSEAEGDLLAKHWGVEVDVFRQTAAPKESRIWVDTTQPGRKLKAYHVETKGGGDCLIHALNVVKRQRNASEDRIMRARNYIANSLGRHRDRAEKAAEDLVNGYIRREYLPGLGPRVGEILTSDASVGRARVELERRAQEKIAVDAQEGSPLPKSPPPAPKSDGQPAAPPASGKVAYNGKFGAGQTPSDLVLLLLPGHYIVLEPIKD